jgi:riboflavin synthase
MVPRGEPVKAGDREGALRVQSSVFTGLIQAVGRVFRIKAVDERRRLLIDPVNWRHGAGRGDSVSINGCCLTVADDPNGEDGLLAFDAVEETLAKSTLGRLEAGDRVNLETALRAGDPLGGHIVQGHVDGVGAVERALKGGPDGTGEWRLRVTPAPGLGRYLVPKGSVCIEGVSLTIADMEPAGGWFEVALIPETLAKTTLRDLDAGDAVNIEMDITSKTIVHYLENHAAEILRRIVPGGAPGGPNGAL